MFVHTYIQDLRGFATVTKVIATELWCTTLREDHFVTVANLWARTQKVIEASGHLCIFLPKFHCELNFIEYFWGVIKKFQRDHCAYTFKTMQEHLPKALESVAAAKTIRMWEHWM